MEELQALLPSRLAAEAEEREEAATVLRESGALCAEYAVVHMMPALLDSGHHVGILCALAFGCVSRPCASSW